MMLVDYFVSLFSKLEKDTFKLADEKYKKEFLENRKPIEDAIAFTFPESYVKYIEIIGFGYFKNDHFDFGMFDKKDLISYNIGVNRFPELEDFILFGQDGGSYLYFFDKNNKLRKGASAIFRVSTSALDGDYMLYVARDFADFFRMIAGNMELNDTWLKDECQIQTGEKQ